MFKASNIGVGALTLVLLATIASPIATPAMASSQPGATRVVDGMPVAGENESCWYDESLDEGVCVPTGEDLVAAVAKEANVRLEITDGSIVSARTVNIEESLEGVVAARASYALSTIYDGANYGGSSYTMAVGSSKMCTDAAYGHSTLAEIGWNDMPSSYKSYGTCKTKLWENTNYKGSSHGYYVNASSLGTMNNKASSWRVAQ